jgi:hypothetical protein
VFFTEVVGFASVNYRVGGQIHAVIKDACGITHHLFLQSGFGSRVGFAGLCFLVCICSFGIWIHLCTGFSSGWVFYTTYV